MKNKDFATKTAEVGERIATKRFAFVMTTIIVFFILFAVLTVFDIVPEPIAEPATSVDSGVTSVAEAATLDLTAEPTRVIAESIGLDVAVNNPTSRDVAVLDQSLLTGVVRYPGSGGMGDEGTMFMFGHSSHLPIIHNQNYKAFNGLKDLKNGDLITVESGTAKNVYRVTSVAEAKADAIRIDLGSSNGKRLVLSTCDSFGGKDARYVVEAAFVGSYSLSSS